MNYQRSRSTPLKYQEPTILTSPTQPPLTFPHLRVGRKAQTHSFHFTLPVSGPLAKPFQWWIQAELR